MKRLIVSILLLSTLPAYALMSVGQSPGGAILSGAPPPAPGGCSGTVLSDGFNEAGGESISLAGHLPETGGTWTNSDVANGKFLISSSTDEVRTGDNTTGWVALQVSSPSCADISVTVNGKAGAINANDRFGPVLSYSDADDSGVRAYIGGNGNVNLILDSAGSAIVSAVTVASVIGSFSTTTYYDLKLERSGNTVNVYIDGILALTGTEATLNRVGMIGMYIRQGNARITSITAAYP